MTAKSVLSQFVAAYGPVSRAAMERELEDQSSLSPREIKVAVQEHIVWRCESYDGMRDAWI